MDKTTNIDNTSKILKELKDVFDISSKRNQLLETQLNNLQENIIMLNYKLATKRKRLQFYESNYQKLQQQANNYILQQSKANVTYAINKNMIEKVKAEEKNDILPITACSNSNKTREHYENEKQELLTKIDRLQETIKKNNAIIKQYLNTKLF